VKDAGSEVSLGTKITDGPNRRAGGVRWPDEAHPYGDAAAEVSDVGRDGGGEGCRGRGGTDTDVFEGARLGFLAQFLPEIIVKLRLDFVFFLHLCRSRLFGSMFIVSL
jgi:hypothetical protein